MTGRGEIPLWEVTMNRLMLCAFISLSLAANGAAQQPACCPEQATHEKQQLLWQKMVDGIGKVDGNLSGVMGVGILDLTSGQQYLLHGDDVFPQASSIKIAVLAELYHQQQQAQDDVAGKQHLKDIYTVRAEDMVQDSDIMQGLTPGVTQLTNRDLATMMVAVSDNSATNALIDRLGMGNVNAMLRSLGLHHTALRRKMMDVKAASEGRENVATPREMVALLAAIYHNKLFNKELTDDFFKMLSTASGSNAKGSNMVRGIPGGIMVAEKPGELEGVRADSGVVFMANRPFVLSIMTTYLSDEKDGARAITDVTRAAFAYFDMVGRASEYGRVISVHNAR